MNCRRVFKQRIWTLLLVGLSTAVVARAGEPSPLRRAAELVEELGHEEFAIREQASAKLIELGVKAVAALEKGKRSPSREIRYRSKRIHRLITAVDFQRRLERFKNDTDPQRDYDLPGWQRFREAAGSDSGARSLFALMHEEEPALMAATRRDDGGFRVLTGRCEELQRRLQFGGDELSLGTVAALLFLATDDRFDVTPMVRNAVYISCDASTFQGAIESGPKRQPLAKLAGAWIRRDNLQPVAYAVSLGLQHDIKECLPKARAALRQPTTPSDQIYGCLGVAKFGDQSDLALLESYLEDVNICGQAQVDGQVVVTQIRDLALASLVHLADKDFGDYGFDRLQRRRRMLFDLPSLGFRDDDRRQQAIAAWREYRKKDAKQGDSKD
jgi:hypothetical protein